MKHVVCHIIGSSVNVSFLTALSKIYEVLLHLASKPERISKSSISDLQSLFVKIASEWAGTFPSFCLLPPPSFPSLLLLSTPPSCFVSSFPFSSLSLSIAVSHETHLKESGNLQAWQ